MFRCCRMRARQMYDYDPQPVIHANLADIKYGVFENNYLLEYLERLCYCLH